MQVCILGDQQHCDEAQANNLPFMSADDLKKLNKNKKLVKNLGKAFLLIYLKNYSLTYLLSLTAKKYDAFLASEALIKQIPRLLGPGLNKAGKFPGPLSHTDSMIGKVEEVKATIKFQMKKVHQFISISIWKLYLKILLFIRCCACALLSVTSVCPATIWPRTFTCQSTSWFLCLRNIGRTCDPSTSRLRWAVLSACTKLLCFVQ